MPEPKQLPQAAITAASLRRMADELNLQADLLDAAAGLHAYQPKKRVSFRHGKWGNEQTGAAGKGRRKPKGETS